MPILIRPDILESDEAIATIFAHEFYEIEGLRKIVQRRGWISIEQSIADHAWDDPGHLHDQGWDIADAPVRRMRGEANRPAPLRS